MGGGCYNIEHCAQVLIEAAMSAICGVFFAVVRVHSDGRGFCWQSRELGEACCLENRARRQEGGGGGQFWRKAVY